jgi:imidazolonepropionase-like amidohydrolase
VGILFDFYYYAMSRFLLVFLYLCLMGSMHLRPTVAQSPRGRLLQHAKVVDVHRGLILNDHQVWVVGDTIRAVVPSDSLLPPAVDTFDLGGRFLMPGFTDAHVHYFQSGGLYTRPDVIDLRAIRSYELERNWLAAHARELWQRYLAAGITTTIDMGGPMSNFELRDQADTLSLAPNLWLAGPLLASYLPPELAREPQPILEVTSAAQAREEVRRQAARGSDLIKIWYIVLPGQSPHDFQPIAEAIIEAAHQQGLPVAVHATQLKTARLAVELGANILVHSVEDQEVDSNFVQLLLHRRVAYCPTLTVGESYEEVLAGPLDLRPEDWALAQPQTLGSLYDLQRMPQDQLPEWVQTLRAQPYQAPAKLSTMHRNLRILSEAGVPILTGTDAGNIGTLHASSYFEEIEAMQQAGLTVPEILRASTSRAAEILHRRTGRVAAGYAADLLILNQNPLLDLAHWYPAAAVIRKGELYRPEDLIPHTPETVVANFLNACRSGEAKRIESYLYPSVVHYRRRSQFVGITGVGLVWRGKNLPSGAPMIEAHAQTVLVYWGSAQWRFLVEDGTIRRIWGP